MTQIVNLTPHPLRFYRGDEVLVDIPPTAPAARVAVGVSQVGEINGIPVTVSDFGAVVNLPPPLNGVVYVVSLLVQQAVPNRSDLLRPDTSPQSVVRNEDGQIIGVRALSRL